MRFCSICIKIGHILKLLFYAMVISQKKNEEDIIFFKDEFRKMFTISSYGMPAPNMGFNSTLML